MSDTAREEAIRTAMDGDVAANGLPDNESIRLWDDLVHFSEVYRRERLMPPNESARARFLIAAGYRQASQQPAPEDVRDELVNVVDNALWDWASDSSSSDFIVDRILAVFDVRRKP